MKFMFDKSLKVVMGPPFSVVDNTWADFFMGPQDPPPKKKKKKIWSVLREKTDIKCFLFYSLTTLFIHGQNNFLQVWMIWVFFVKKNM